MIATLESVSSRAIRPASPAAPQDARIRTLARWALDNSPYQAMSHLDCQVADGAIVLSGVAPSFFLKQLAQELVLRLDCDYRIDNRVEVKRRCLDCCRHVAGVVSLVDEVEVG
jgi:hypothetical protein